MSSYTKEQETIVLKVLSYKSHQYYEILAVTKTASDSEIKKSYRKLAVKLHPDKNPHPRSSEAFKFLNKAWSVLGDEKKKQIFDQTGADPDSRSAGFASGSSPFAREGATAFRGNGGAGGVFEEDIFNMFFGGGGNQFGGPTFSFGGNGFTFQSFGGNEHPFFQTSRSNPRQQQQRRNARQQANQEPSTLDTLKTLLPIFLFLLIPILSAFFGDSNSIPDYSFTPSRQYNIQRTTPKHKIPFFVNEKAFQKKQLNDKQLKNFDLKVENLFIQDKRSKCSKEQIYKNELMEEAQGWFSVDTKKLAEAETMPMPNCKILRDLNLIWGLIDFI